MTLDPYVPSIQRQVRARILTDNEQLGYPTIWSVAVNEKFANEHPDILDVVIGEFLAVGPWSPSIVPKQRRRSQPQLASTRAFGRRRWTRVLSPGAARSGDAARHSVRRRPAPRPRCHPQPGGRGSSHLEARRENPFERAIEKRFFDERLLCQASALTAPRRPPRPPRSPTNVPHPAQRRRSHRRCGRSGVRFPRRGIRPRSEARARLGTKWSCFPRAACTAPPCPKRSAAPRSRPSHSRRYSAFCRPLIPVWARSLRTTSPRRKHSRRDAGPTEVLLQALLQGERIGNALSEATNRNGMGGLKTPPREDQRRLFSSTAPRAYCTGAVFAHWVPIFALDEDDVLRMRTCGTTRPALTIHDDWSSMGQRTTASGTNRHRECLRHGPRAHHSVQREQAGASVPPGARSRTPPSTLGIGGGAFKDALEYIRTRSRPWHGGSYARLADEP